MTCPLPIRLTILLSALAMPVAGYAENGIAGPIVAADAGQETPPEQSNANRQDCDDISSLPEKRACYGRQDQALIDACEHIHPLRCRPYRDMDASEADLTEVEKASIAAARKAYAAYVEGDPAYLRDLDTAAQEAGRTWRAFRETQCTLEPFAQGMSRHASEDLVEACRARMTRARIDELKSLYAPARMEHSRP